MMCKALDLLRFGLKVSFIIAFLGAYAQTLSAESITSRILNVPQGVGAMVWDAPRSRFFVSSGTNVLIVNPDTAQVEDMIAVGNPTTQVAISDDGQYLYVSVEGAPFGAPGTINRYRVQDQSLNLQIPLGVYSGGNRARDVNAMLVLPGRPSALLVALSDGTLAVFDDAVARPSPFMGNMSSLYVRASDGAIFGYGDGTTGFGTPRIWWLTVSNSGVSVARSVPVNPIWDSGTVTWNGNLITNKNPFSSFVFDLNAGATIGSFPLPQMTGSSGACVLAPDSSGTSTITYAYDYRSDGSIVSLVRYSITNLQPTASSPLTGLPPDYVSLSSVCGSMAATWGTDGIAMSNQAGQLFFLHASGLAPVTPKAIPKPAIDGSRVIHLALPANGLVYDSGRNLVWASIAGTAGAAGNSMVSIDPATGVVVDKILCGQ